VGGGAILKSGTTVHGTATAASILNVAVIGAVGFRFYDLGFILALANFLVLAVITPLKTKHDEHSEDNAGPGDGGSK
jgi:putative Mg2+ transporter-C (MgtC) family protein